MLLPSRKGFEWEGQGLLCCVRTRRRCVRRPVTSSVCACATRRRSQRAHKTRDADRWGLRARWECECAGVCSHCGSIQWRRRPPVRRSGRSRASRRRQFVAFFFQ
eukprot:1301058-Prymnesium_polylepis.1